MFKYFLLVFLAQSAAPFVRANTWEYVEYEYSVQRNILEEREKEFSGYQKEMTKMETIVDNYLEYLKWAEFNTTKDAFPPSRPIELVLDQIKASKVYKILKKFPKGGNLHLHQNHILPKRKMLELIFNSSLLDELCINVGNTSNKWNLNFYNTPPTDWEKVKDNALYSIEFLLQHITLINTLPADAKAEPTNSGLRWKYMNPMFGRAATDMVLYQNYTRMHMQALFQHALSENVQYLEARANGDGMYVLDDSAPNGHRLVDNSTDGDLWFQTITEELKKFRSDHPEFIGYKEIIQGRRYKNAAANRDTLEGALRLREKFPDLVKGYDLVAEEDQGYSLLFYIDEFANVTSQNRNIPFYFHTAETNWPNDLMTSQHPTDPVRTTDNVYEAII